MSTEAVCHLSMPHMERFYDQVFANHRGATAMVRPNSHVGQRVVICGAGPSLRQAILPEAEEVWACNSALPYLVDRGIRVTHGITIDQGEAMLAPHEWGRCLPVAYYLASSVHPELPRRLRAAGCALTFFHSFLGIPAPEDWVLRDGFTSYEDWLYRKLFPLSVCVGWGLNSVPRAVSLAVAMGFSRIDVFGADCACQPGGPPIPALPGTADYTAWLDRVVLYADGRTARCYGDDAPMAQAEIDGRLWHTRPDMVISARHLLDLEQLHPGQIFFHGDTLVSALRWLDPTRLPALEHSRITNFALPSLPEATTTLIA